MTFQSPHHGVHPTYARLFSHVPHAFASLRSQPVRVGACFAVISIGVCMLLCVLGLLNGARKQVLDQVAAMGASSIYLRAPSTLIQSAEFERILEQLQLHPQVRDVGTLAERRVSIGSDRSVMNFQAPLLVADPAFTRVAKIRVRDGRLPAAADVGVAASLCAVGAELASQLRVGLGDRVLVNDQPLRVIGVIDRRIARRDGASISSRNLNQAIVVAPGAYPEVAGEAARGEVLIVCRDAGDVRDVSMFLRDALSATLSEGVELVVPVELLQTRSRTQRVLAACVVVVIMLTALSVAGGAATVLTLAVQERRSELAIRRALGARRADIHAQMLIEGLLLVGAGCVVGVVLSLLLLHPLALLLQVTSQHSIASISVVVLGALLVGALAVSFPARAAGRVHPASDLQR